MEEIAAWVAPAATMLAAMLTAANLGARVTGWGFVVFTVGAIAWSVQALATGQQNLLYTNLFLTAVDAFGIWRWLGRQARYEDGSRAATRRSAHAKVPTLLSLGALHGAKLTGRDGDAIGEIVEGMLRCGDAGLAYLVVSEGGVGGAGERLHALHPAELVFAEEGVSCDLTAADLRARPVLVADDWPAAVEERQSVRIKKMGA